MAKCICLVVQTVLAFSMLSGSMLAQAASGVATLGRNPLQIAILHWYDANLTTSFATGPVGCSPGGVAFDGASIWVANGDCGTATKLRASDGALLGTFTLGGYGSYGVA